MSNITKEVAINICNHISSLYNVNVMIYRNETQIDRIDAIESSYRLESIYEDAFFHSQNKISYILTPELLLFGSTKFDNEYCLILGPIRTVGTYTENVARQIALAYPKTISHISDIADLQKYLLQLPNISFNNFSEILSLLWVAMTHTVVSKDIVKPLVSFSFSPEDTEKALIKEEYATYETEYIDAVNIDYEKKLLNLIEHGQSEEMKHYLLSYNANIWKMGNTPLRQAKNAAIVLNSIALRATIRGNLPPSVAYDLGSINLQRIESASNVATLSQFCSDMMYDYCQRVHQVQSVHTSDDKINEVLIWIESHIHEKMSVSTIAAHFHLSREYLSRHFHEITGQTLANYITLQKVYEAKRLLALTNMPLIEISDYLSFSSQNYFNTVFKQTEGMTPQRYRKTVTK